MDPSLTGPPYPIFLLSLPRCGSTLLQRILAGHPAVATAAEPWLLLPWLSPFGYAQRSSDRNFGLAGEAINEFLSQCPDNGPRRYRETVRAAALSLYAQHAQPDQAFFLDKTPRYHLIAETIAETFPDARFLLLWRNPLAVISSMIDTWLRGRFAPDIYAVDLFDGLEALLHFQQAQPGRFLELHYEQLTANPEAAARRACDWLGLEYHPSMLDVSTTTIEGRLGDPNRTTRHRIANHRGDTFPSLTSSHVRRRWCERYLDWIGDPQLLRMGYAPETLRQQLQVPHSGPTTRYRDSVSALAGRLAATFDTCAARARQHERARIFSPQGLARAFAKGLITSSWSARPPITAAADSHPVHHPKS